MSLRSPKTSSTGHLGLILSAKRDVDLNAEQGKGGEGTMLDSQFHIHPPRDMDSSCSLLTWETPGLLGLVFLVWTVGTPALPIALI